MSETMKRAVGAILALFIALGASAASAQTFNGMKVVWTVPGVVDNGAVKTAFACTNNNTTATDVAVQVYDKNGTAIGDATLTLGPDQTRLFSTSTLSSFLSDANLGAGSLIDSTGFGRIFSTSRSNVNCSAWISRGDSMATLTIAKKTKQKGD